MIERSIAFGPGEALVGTLCLPEATGGRAATLGVIAFNAGVVHRIGPHRANVRLARRLAKHGIPSLRFDLSGQGDSARLPSAAGYQEQAVAEIRMAVDALVAGAGVGRAVLFGICSGGVHSYAAAQRDERIAGAILYDTYIYPTRRSRLNRYWLKLRHRSASAIVRDAFDKFVRSIGGTHAGPSRVAPMASGFVTPPPEEFARVARALHARGTRLAMVYSGAFEQYNYAAQFRDRFRPLGLEGLVASAFLPHLGHTATLLADQSLLLDWLEAWLATLETGVASGAT